MSQMDMFLVALASACAAFPVLGVLWWIRDRADRAAAAGLDTVDIDPYHAVATARRPSRVGRAAAAELLLAGLIRIRDDGMMEVTDRAQESATAPGHPVPAALLATLRRQGEPFPLSRLYWESGYTRQRDAFLRAEDLKVPRWSLRTRDSIAGAAFATLILFTLWISVQVVFLRQEYWTSGVGPIVVGAWCCLVLWALMAVPLVWLAERCWPKRRDRFAAYCRRLPAHPAERALSTEERDLLDRSWTWRNAYERAKDEETWVDHGGGF
ncbi:hypothetical protein [Streptomyces ambofaciens]|uniref:hypothetical protein n=1 Tax=Streptomyces ambofaciens TaxID=1889 RepID=UPI0011E028DB|nr:hypothetical protein [Streptomyces ambofaciens]